MDKTLIDELSQLNKNEKLLLVEALWDSIASDPEEVDVPDHHISILEKRLQTLNAEERKRDYYRGRYSNCSLHTNKNFRRVC